MANEKQTISEAWCDGYNTRELEVQPIIADLKAKCDAMERQLQTIRAMDVYLVQPDTNPDAAFMAHFYREKLSDAIKHAAMESEQPTGD